MPVTSRGLSKRAEHVLMISLLKRRIRNAVRVYGYDVIRVPKLLPRDDPRTIPGMLIVSIPKSGTVYINQLLSRGLDVPSVSAGLNYFPCDLADIAGIELLARGGCVAPSHLPPTSQNLRILETMLDRWVVHIRDPRSVVVSLAHHFARLHVERPRDLLMMDPAPPASYGTMSLRGKIEWVVDNHAQSVVSWTKAWLDVAGSGRYNICLTSYDELHENETALVYKILDFFHVPRSRYRAPALEKKVDATHYREGRLDEWRMVLGAQLLYHVNGLIGSELLQFFRWPLE